jgi:hypothetical protein
MLVGDDVLRDSFVVDRASRCWDRHDMVSTSLFLLVDGAMKLVKPTVVVKTTMELGYADTVIPPLGAVLLACTILYLIPRTAVFGAILLTGYLGGAVATQVRAGRGPFEILFPVALGVLLWGGLVPRDDRLRTLIPLRH